MIEEFSRIIRLWGRQSGLDHQMKVSGREVMVYDHREEISLPKIIGLVPEYNEIWHTDDVNSNVPYLSEKGLYVVSAYPCRGFSYSCCGHMESDREYVALRTSSEEQLERLASQFGNNGAENIIVGREVDKRAVRDFARQYLSDSVRRKVDLFYKSSREEQERILMGLFQKQRLGGQQ